MHPNPLARIRRVGTAIHTLRTERGHNHTRLARLSGISAAMISRLENSLAEPHRRPNVTAVASLLDALDIPEHTTILEWAEQAAAPRWWDRYPRMGDGQRTHALVELGAAQIVEYGGLMIPGLAQTAEYARHRVLASNGTPVTDPAPVVAARLARQQVLDTAVYRLVVEEQAIRRHPAPRPVMAAQLHHLLALADRPNISVRVVPVDADLGDGYAPRAPYAHISYPDPGDPTIVVVDNVTPVLVTESGAVDRYVRLHERLRKATLSDRDSAVFIREAAGRLLAGS